jgi:hypothetical protein
MLIAISARRIYNSPPKLIRQLFTRETPVNIEEDPQRDG